MRGHGLQVTFRRTTRQWPERNFGIPFILIFIFLDFDVLTMLRYAPVDVENISASSSGHATRDSVKHSIEAPALFNHVMAGSCSRAASTCLTYPLDTLKTRLQCCSTSSSFIGKDLLLGISGSLPGTMASAAVYFLVDNLTRRYLSSPDSILGKRDPSDPIFHCTSASLATLASAFLRVPSDVLKHRVQARVYPSFSSAATGIIRSKGPMGCYAGFSATLLRDIPETAIQFALFAKLKQHFCSDSNCTSSSKESLPCQMMLLGGAAGVASSFVCTPLDVIKTKLQCGSSRSIIGAVGSGRGERHPRAICRCWPQGYASRGCFRHLLHTI